MATNEHKNLDNDNLHLPLDFSTAGANTVLSKNVDNELAWVSESHMRCDFVKIQGYGTALSGGSTGYYMYRDDLTDNDSPYLFNQDFGTADAESGVVTTNVCMRTAGDVVNSTGEVFRIRGWATGNGVPTISIAIMRLPLIDNDNDDVVPILLDEFSITAAGNDTPRSFLRESADFLAVPTLTAGDIIFPMIKSSLASTSIYFNLTIETRNT